MLEKKGCGGKCVIVGCYQSEALQREIMDLQSEFEFDRIDYLDTIRKQEQHMKYLQAVIDKIHPALRRDCNYVNLDRIRAHAEWDELNQQWNLPKMAIEKSHLPPAAGEFFIKTTISDSLPKDNHGYIFQI